MKKIILFFIPTIFLLTSCYKTDPIVFDLLKKIQTQNEDLRNQVLAMQKSTDSLSKYLSSMSVTANNQNRQLDSIKYQLNIVLSQITLLSTQLLSTNANILEIQAKLVALQATCDQLLKLMNDCCSSTMSSLSNGLVAWYPFNGNANDSSGNKYHGIAFGVQLASDRFGKPNSSYRFAGASSNNGTSNDIDNNISVPGFNYDFKNQISISIWASIEPTGSCGFISRRVDNSIDFDITYYTTNNRIYGHFGGLGEIIGNIYTTYNTWTLFTYTYNGAELRTYVNGVLDVVKPTTGNISNISSILNIGKYIYHGGMTHYAYFNGKLDDIRIYNRSLSQDEISYLAKH